MYLSSSLLEMLISGKRWVIIGDVARGEGSEDNSRGDDNITKSDAMWNDVTRIDSRSPGVAARCH